MIQNEKCSFQMKWMNEWIVVRRCDGDDFFYCDFRSPFCNFRLLWVFVLSSLRRRKKISHRFLNAKWNKKERKKIVFFCDWSECDGIKCKMLRYFKRKKDSAKRLRSGASNCDWNWKWNNGNISKAKASISIMPK